MTPELASLLHAGFGTLRDVLPITLIVVFFQLFVLRRPIANFRRMLIGFAFVIFYAVMGLPIARLVDTRSRRLILGICVSIWSGMTALCGLAQNLLHLIIARPNVPHDEFAVVFQRE